MNEPASVATTKMLNKSVEARSNNEAAATSAGLAPD